MNYDAVSAAEFSGLFQNGLFRFELKRKSGLLDRNGKIIAPFEFADIQPNVTAPFVAKRKNKWQLLDKNFKPLNDFTADYVSYFSEGRAAFRKKDKWGYIDEKGKVIHKPEFAEAAAFSEGRAKIKTESGLNFLMTDGKYLLPADVDKITPLDEEFIWVERAGKKALYHLKQQKLIWKEQGFQWQ
jgi:hypothetical protein